MIPKIKLYDISFAHEKSGGSSRNYGPKLFQWDRVGQHSNLAVFTDQCLPLALYSKEKCKVAWLVEISTINADPYRFAIENQNKFDLIISTSKSFLKEITPNKAKAINFGGTWVDLKSDLTKTKNISIVASNKNFTTGHSLRHQLIKVYGSKMDLYGSAYRPIEDKTEAIAPYRYSVAIENSSIPGYFTEKFLDCTISKTIPVYYGDPDIGQVFNTDAIIDLNSLSGKDTFERILIDSKFAEEFYNMNSEAIKQNYVVSHEYLNADDRVYMAIKEYI